MKPLLSLEEQIKHLKNKGVSFDIMDEDYARHYLSNHNNYFKLAAYRKNYNKHPAGMQKGLYINLEFAYLVDMAIIDMRLRYRIVHLSLDIEHYAKLQLLNAIETNGEDGYAIVSDYIDSLPVNHKNILNNELSRNKTSIYCGDIVSKYDPAYPVWAFLEIIPFGRMVSFYNFCGLRFDDKLLYDNYFRLLTCKDIRNAAAHNNCILNDLRPGTAGHKTNNSVTQELSAIENMTPQFRKAKMSNARIQQVITLLYTHNHIVNSEGVSSYECNEIQNFKERMLKNIAYYNNNDLIKGSFDFLKLVIDKWYPRNVQCDHVEKKA